MLTMEPSLNITSDRRSIQPLLLLVAVFVVFSGAFILVSRARFNQSYWVVSAHLVLVLALLSGSLLAAAVIRIIWQSGKWITLLPVIFLAVALCGIYAINTIGWYLWIDSISIKLIGFYARQLNRFPSGALPIPGKWLAVLPLIALFLIVAAFAAGAEPLYAAVDSRIHSLFGRKRPIAWSLVSLLVYGMLLGGCFWIAMDCYVFRGEPLFSLICPLRPTASQLPRTFYSGRASSPPESYRVSQDSSRKNVIVIVVDSLRADHLPAFGYRRSTTPLLTRRLSRTPALTARWATSQCSISECGILAIMTSHQYQRLHGDLFALPSALRSAGYDNYFLLSGDFSNSFRGLYMLVGKDARVFTDGVASNRYSATDDRVVLDALHPIPNRTGRPAFFYFHLNSVHLLGVRYSKPVFQPTRFDLADAFQFGVRNSFIGFSHNSHLMTLLSNHITKSYTAESDLDREILINNYDNGILQADAVIDQILSSLRQKGYLEHAVVVVTADHGEALGEHGAFLHGSNLYAESINIPLILFDTDLPSARDVPYATHLDIAPTIAGMVGLPIPREWEGASLLTSSTNLSFSQTTSSRPIEAAIWRTPTESYKYIFDTLDSSETLFELTSDPAERLNRIVSANPTLVEYLRRARIRNFGQPEMTVMHAGIQVEQGATAAIR